jgi:hypothetical protein
LNRRLLFYNFEKKVTILNILLSSLSKHILLIFLFISGFTIPLDANATTPFHYGIKTRIGGRYDNVRMCVATDAGVNGGPAMDISGFVSWGLKNGKSIEFDLPIGRPILFGAAFDMLQFEPSVTLKFRFLKTNSFELTGGPVVGITFHYGPDKDSESSGDGRTDSFFALGVFGGGYTGITFLRPKGSFDLQIGITLYATKLQSINDDNDHKGFVLGGSLDIGFRFK